MAGVSIIKSTHRAFFFIELFYTTGKISKHICCQQKRVNPESPESKQRRGSNITSNMKQNRPPKVTTAALMYCDALLISSGKPSLVLVSE